MLDLIDLLAGAGLTITSALTPISQSSTCTSPIVVCNPSLAYSQERNIASLYGDEFSEIKSTDKDVATKQDKIEITPVSATSNTNNIVVNTQTHTIQTDILTKKLNQEHEGLSSQILFDLINQHRQNLGLEAFIKHDFICQIAGERALELDEEIFGSKSLHAGFRARNLPFWITENMIHQPNERQALDWWLNSPIHKKAIESSHTFSCGACKGNSCTQLFSSLQPKNLQSFEHLNKVQ